MMIIVAADEILIIFKEMKKKHRDTKTEQINFLSKYIERTYLFEILLKLLFIFLTSCKLTNQK